tara:strand:+ start:36681 stop:40088 length:3408 start_codon:yes stop_codon:yes gene_type:complete
MAIENDYYSIDNINVKKCREGQVWNGFQCVNQIIQKDTPPDSLGSLQHLDVMTINVGKFGYFPLSNMQDAGDYPFCDGCYTNNLCNRTDEQDLANEIELKSPDILILTELLPQSFCLDDQCETALQNPNSSCYDDGTTQIERLLRGNYTYTCNTQTPEDGPDGAGFTCTAVKNGRGVIDTPAFTLPTPTECFGISKADHETVSYSYINIDGARLKVIMAHPINAYKLESDPCRKAFYKQIFEYEPAGGLYNSLENIIIGGDFNNDAYRFNWRKIWDWSIPDAKEWVGKFLKNGVNGIGSVGSNYTFYNACPSAFGFGQGSSNIHAEIELQRIDISSVDIQLVGDGTEITNPMAENPMDEFHILITLNFNNLDWEVDLDSSNWTCGAILNGLDRGVDMWGPMVIDLQMTSDGESATLNMENMEINVTEWPNWAEGSVRDGIKELLEEDIQANFLTAFLKFIPMNYNFLRNEVTDTDSIINNTSEYWHDQITFGNKDFIPHNAQPAIDSWDYYESGYSNADLLGSDILPEPTHQLLTLGQTIDYVITNFADTNNCEIIDFWFMDHSAVYCQLDVVNEGPPPEPESSLNFISVWINQGTGELNPYYCGQPITPTHNPYLGLESESLEECCSMIYGDNGSTIHMDGVWDPHTYDGPPFDDPIWSDPPLEFLSHYQIFNCVSILDEYGRQSGNIPTVNNIPTSGGNIESVKMQLSTLSGDNRNIENQTNWEYTQSQYQSFFYFSSDVINTTTNPNDVIGVFKGDTCIGWRYADFTEQYIDVPIMFKDPDLNFNDLTPEQCDEENGFYNNGICTISLCEITGTCDYPQINTSFYPNCTFKYYNSQTGEISNLVNVDAYTTLSETLLYANTFIHLYEYPGIWNIEPETNECTLSYTLSSDSAGYNLVSFPFDLTEGNSLESFFGTNGPVYELIGPSLAATLHNNQWLGSLANQGISSLQGYWLKQTQLGLQLNYSGECLPHDTIYNLNTGNNLISFPGTQSKSSMEVLSGKQDVITGVIGQGVAIAWNQNTDSWVGNLQMFEPGKAYWIKTNNFTEFSFTQSQNALIGETMDYFKLNIKLTPNSSIDEIYDSIFRQKYNKMTSNSYNSRVLNRNNLKKQNQINQERIKKITKDLNERKKRKR